MATIPFLWTNDDINYGMVGKLRRQLQLLDRFDIPGTFFVVPFSPAESGKTLADDVDLLKEIDRARGRGHEFYQHGYRHTPFESGVPETWMLDFNPEERREYDEHRLEIESQHTWEALVAMLESGHRIWRRAFHEDSPGYRPGWGAFCANLYRALEALGYEWVSSRIPSPASWLRNQGQWDAPMNYRAVVPAQPCRIGKIWEYPMAGDYAFRVPNEPARIVAMVELGLQEFAYCHQRGIPFLLLSHYHGLENNNNSGYAVHEQLLTRLLKDGHAEPLRMSELHRRFAADQGKIAVPPSGI